jgi:predicted phosphate transport protein (TIGR00153 family)
MQAAIKIREEGETTGRCFVRIFDIFRKSPFRPLQEMMGKVKECAYEVKPLYEALIEGDKERFHDVAGHISHLEFEADQIKNRIRSSLPRGILMPVARGDILEILSNEDAIADATEDVAVLMTLKDLEVKSQLRECVMDLVDMVLQVVDMASKVIDELDVLMETSFGGVEAQKVIAMIEEVCDMEHHADEAQRRVTKGLLTHEDVYTPGELWLWLKIVAKTGDIANYAERMCNRIRLFLSK